MKKILALVLVAMLAMGMVSALAANDQTFPKGASSSVAGTANNSDVGPAVVNADIGTITFNVYLNDQKPDSAQRPKTQFTYSVADGTADTTKGISQGLASWVTLNNGTTGDLTTDAWDAANGNKADTMTATIAFPAGTGAGIYRFAITQAALTEEQKNIGIESEGTNGAAVTKYLDVYYTAAGKIAGAVLSDGSFTTTTTTGSPDKTENVYSGKTDGFYNKLGDNTTPGAGVDPDDPSDPANTIGYVVTITKEVKGNMGNKNEDFPFTLKLTTPKDDTDANTTLAGLTVYARSTNATDNFQLTVGSDTFQATAITLAAEESASTLNFNLKDGETLTLTGLPATLAFAVKETIAAANGYKISAKIENMGASATAFESSNFASGSDTGSGSTSYNESTNTDTYVTQGVVQKSDTTSGAVTYRNYRESISPTGLVLRFAPYFAMLAAGAALFIILLAKKRRNEDEEA